MVLWGRSVAFILLGVGGVVVSNGCSPYSVVKAAIIVLSGLTGVFVISMFFLYLLRGGIGGTFTKLLSEREGLVLVVCDGVAIGVGFGA